MVEKEGRVGVFTRIYRNDETMHEAIESVLNQTYTNIKFYIMVNENTKNSILLWKEKDKRIEIIDGGIDDGFKTCAKEIALENSYVTTIDADDWYDEKYLECLIDEINSKKVDMVACGNYYFVDPNRIVGERKQVDLEWSMNEISRVLPYVYGHFRTIWGKLMKSQLIINADFDVLPKSNQYGGYGGDTLFMFNLLSYAKRVAISNKLLYYYRMSEGSGTYRLNPGRLDADELVFCFVQNCLIKMGAFEENQKRFLFWIYGNALIDTTKLLLHTKLSDLERLENLVYIFQKPLTKELFTREKIGFLKLEESKKDTKYAQQLYELVFSNLVKSESVSNRNEYYFCIFEIIWSGLKEVLTKDEFKILLKDKVMLDAFVVKDFIRLSKMLLLAFDSFDEFQKYNVSKIMEKIEPTIWLKNVVGDVEFLKKYKELLILIKKNEYDKGFNRLHTYFSKEGIPNFAEELVELWINLAATLENEMEFVLAKQFKVEVLMKKGNLVEATEEYNELLQLGITDANMILLGEYLDI